MTKITPIPNRSKAGIVENATEAFRGDKVLGRGIVTTHDLEREEIDGYQIKSGLGNENNLVNATKNSIEKIGPERIAAFHNAFDWSCKLFSCQV